MGNDDFDGNICQKWDYFSCSDKNCSGEVWPSFFKPKKKRASWEGPVRYWAICRLDLIWPAGKRNRQQTFHFTVQLAKEQERERDSVDGDLHRQDWRGSGDGSSRSDGGPVFRSSSIWIHGVSTNTTFVLSQLWWYAKVLLMFFLAVCLIFDFRIDGSYCLQQTVCKIVYIWYYSFSLL